MTDYGKQMKENSTLYVICGLTEPEGLLLGGYTIIPKLKGDQIQAFSDMLLSFFKALQNQSLLKISLLALPSLSHQVHKSFNEEVGITFIGTFLLNIHSK